MLRKLTIYICYGCMMALTMLTLSCERDTWLADTFSNGTGEPVNVLLSIEVPDADKVAVTRTMSELEEHNVKDLYILIFDAEDATNGYPLISRQYFDESAINVDKTNHANGEWSSVLDGEGNSTHGVVMARALDKNCFIFGIANVRGDDSEVSKSTTSSFSTLDDALLALKPMSSTETNPSKLSDFYALQAEMKSDISLGRNNSHLLMSGVFVPKDKYKPAGYDTYGSKYTQGQAGLVDISQASIVADENGNVDLTKAGVIRLRRLASHIKFKIKINGDIDGDGVVSDNEQVFSDFKPESWRVYHVPNRSYLMDRGDETPKITEDAYFSYPDAEKSMIHADGTYQFDFYMYENHKQARDIHDMNDASAAGYSLWGTMSAENKAIVTSYYQPQFGYTINDTDTSGGACLKLSSLFDNDATAFKYYKRELALKSNNGSYISKNIDDTKVKQFVYVEPNATYVEIKGRLRFNTANFKLTDLIKRGGTDHTTDEAIKDGYADVTYLVHLGYARKKSLTDELRGTGTESEEYKMADFNSLRNTEYTYNIEIQGVNSIFTQVVTESPDDADKRESAKIQAGASGFIGMATEDVYNTDAHFNSFNIFLDVAHLDKDNVSFIINTPWTEIRSEDITEESYNSSTSPYYKFNPDFTWIKVRRNYDQTLGNNTDFVHYVGSDNRTTMPYFKEQKSGVSDADYESTYHFKTNPLIDLYQLKKELAKLSTTGLPVTIDGISYTAKLEINDASVKVLNYYSGNTKVGSLQGLFYTVYLDEYYYHTPPVGQSWAQPYWHEFVNRPARYVSFSTNSVGNAASTFDGESSLIKPQLMILQPSIQTHYATNGGIIVGLGMEHYNETPHPRWTDNGPAGTPSTSGYTGDKTKYGWINAYNNIVGNDKVTWDAYVADYVGNDNNLTMVPNKKNGSVPAVNFKGNNDNDAQYKAGAIRLCMNRNRDENGNGVIDENELKWYLPASSQIDIISMCHYSFFDPLLNYNDFLYGVDADGNPTYRLKNYQGTYADVSGGGDMRGANFYYQHYVASDYRKLTSEEMMNLNNYNTYANYIYGTGEMRCVRNLGEATDDNHTATAKSVLKPYTYYNADGTVTMDVSDARKELQTYTGSQPNVMFEFTKKEVKKGNSWIFTDKIFIMEKYLDSRSIRTAKYVNEELPPHYLFSETNRPYKAFQVAQDEVYMNIKDPRWTVKYGDAVFIDLETIYTKRPCAEYSEEDDESDLGSWRAPNAAEISLMIHYLRVNDTNGTAKESTTPALFFKETNPYPFTCTSWNFAGQLWARMVAVKAESPRKLWMSDPYYVTATSASSNFTFGKGTEALYTNTVPLRCVKDVEPPIE